MANSPGWTVEVWKEHLLEMRYFHWRLLPALNWENNGKFSVACVRSSISSLSDPAAVTGRLPSTPDDLTFCDSPTREPGRRRSSGTGKDPAGLVLLVSSPRRDSVFGNDHTDGRSPENQGRWHCVEQLSGRCACVLPSQARPEHVPASLCSARYPPAFLERLAEELSRFLREITSHWPTCPGKSSSGAASPFSHLLSHFRALPHDFVMLNTFHFCCEHSLLLQGCPLFCFSKVQLLTELANMPPSCVDFRFRAEMSPPALPSTADALSALHFDLALQMLDFLSRLIALRCQSSQTVFALHLIFGESILAFFGICSCHSPFSLSNAVQE
ncbi:hypothetical protein KC340_g11 [Hortaea werneckii]|nr:hypothetical protein KC340_g11 [Hortaea werneckii]